MGEITPGLVVYLSVDLLAARGDCLSNVDVGGLVDRVHGSHYFLILTEADEHDRHLAVLLHSKWKQGRVPLRDSEKTGPAKDWIASSQRSYFSRYQHWKIPAAAINEASGDDDGSEGDHRRYANHTPRTRDFIINCQEQNRKKTFDPVH